jgi:chromosome segregation ATPase
MSLPGVVVGAALAPLRGASRALDSLERLAEVAERFEAPGGPAERMDDLRDVGRDIAGRRDALMDQGERLDERGAELLALGERVLAFGERIDARFAALDRHMEALDAHFQRFDAHLRRLLELADEIEGDLPQMREAAAAVSDLRDSAEPVAAAAERAERVAQRIPGLRR